MSRLTSKNVSAKSNMIIDKLNDKSWNLILNGATLMSVNKDFLRDIIRSLYSKLAEYENKQEQGVLVELPIPNDTSILYAINVFTKEIIESNVIDISLDGGIAVHINFESEDVCCECKGCPFASFYTNHEAGDGGCNSEGCFLFST